MLTETQREETWQVHLAFLRAYVEREGNAVVPFHHVEDGHPLGCWVSDCRRQRKAGKMPAQRVAELEGLGMAWEVVDRAALWETGLGALRVYVNREGHAAVPSAHIEDGYPLGAWVARRRRDAKQGRLSPERRALLDELEMVWSVRSRPNTHEGPAAESPLGHGRENRVQAWEANLAALRAYALREGTAAVPQSHVENGRPIGGWVAQCRLKARWGKLTPEKRAQLDALGMIWEPVTDITHRTLAWMRGVEAMQSYIRRYGHAQVSQHHVENGFNLGKWAKHRRQDARAGRLRPGLKAELDAMGFVWNPVRNCPPAPVGVAIHSPA